MGGDQQSTMKRFISLLSSDFCLLILAFGLVHRLNYGDLQISTNNLRVFLLLSGTWLGVSLVTGKFTGIPRISLQRTAKVLLKNGMAMVFVVSLWIVGLQRMHFSRAMVYGTLGVFVFLETLPLLYYLRKEEKALTRAAKKVAAELVPRHVTVPLFALDGTLLIGATFLVKYVVKGKPPLMVPPYCDLLPILTGLWFGVSLVTGKFDKKHFTDFFSALGLSFKSFFIMAASLAALVYALRLEELMSRAEIFGPLTILLAAEAVVFCLYINYRQYRGESGGGDIEDAAAVRNIIAKEKAKDELPLDAAAREPGQVTEPAGEKLEYALEFFDARILKMLTNNVDTRTIEKSACSLLSTDDMFNLEIIDDSSMDLILNLHKANDFRRLNVYFLTAHQKLVPGGYLMGKAYTIANQYDHYKHNYPRGLSNLFYTVVFIWGRVFPKLPLLKKFYFAVTKGRNRMISRAEVLGRLAFCGFKIVADDEQGQEFFFLARKVRHPSPNENPTYGPLVKLQRSGMGGRVIDVYKFRTMYPFSEFLQEYVYENCNLSDGGKFKDDFRVTGWGRFMRRNWLDELPMFYNWFRGEMQLVGVRPISRHYLELYEKDVRELRHTVKPGLLPPFYADMPSTLEEIMESERRYIQSYRRKPVRTQVRYFIKCVWNIVVRKRRSA